MHVRPQQFGIVDQGWLSHFAISKIKGSLSVIYGDGKQVRDAVHIQDVIDLLVKQSAALVGESRGSVRWSVV